MPLFMDFHKIDGITVERVKTDHTADLAVQEKYGVKYHQFWVNQEAGTVFCLTEGPDKESCEAVHREAHGNLACAMVEVQPGYFEMFMGKDHKLDPSGLVLNPDGSTDAGYRYVMAVNIRRVSPLKGLTEYGGHEGPVQARKLIFQKIEALGRRVEWSSNDCFVGAFDSSANAVRCARGIQAALKLKQNEQNDPEWDLVVRFGVSAAQPVTAESDFFGEAVKLAGRLSSLGEKNQIILSSLAGELYAEAVIDNANQKSDIRSINENDEEFLSALFNIAETKLADENFTIDTLSREIGVSRPQLYRKVVTLTGKSPNDFVRDLRMNKALMLLRKRSLNISQVAMEVGYNNPSYFSRCFAEKFGCTPSGFMVTSVSDPV